MCNVQGAVLGVNSTKMKEIAPRGRWTREPAAEMPTQVYTHTQDFHGWGAQGSDVIFVTNSLQKETLQKLTL